jgi:hypothetical protein
VPTRPKDLLGALHCPLPGASALGGRPFSAA